jgi:hypothetical protein
MFQADTCISAASWSIYASTSKGVNKYEPGNCISKINQTIATTSCTKNDSPNNWYWGLSAKINSTTSSINSTTSSINSTTSSINSTTSSKATPISTTGNIESRALSSFAFSNLLFAVTLLSKLIIL